ncbi:adenine glycosylase [Collinsella sp. zg1085]|nr:adenine glycosylase [Collinsella sp. zg1085]
MVANEFRSFIRQEGQRLYRDLAWRNTQDPYYVWLSEVMLQQTQVSRVVTRWAEWIDAFPSVFALAEASTARVLAAWQGMGYNRRALSLKAAAERIVAEYDGIFPQSARELVSLPGIGPATAQGIRSFAYNLPGVYLETNVRTVFIHHFFQDVPDVPDKELIPLIEATCPGEQQPFALPQDAEDTSRAWYYALLDYGAELKRQVPNPSRRSKSYSRQSKFEGSRRQKRAELVRLLLAAGEQGRGLELSELIHSLSAFELASGRPPVAGDLVQSILGDLVREGFCRENQGSWRII